MSLSVPPALIIAKEAYLCFCWRSRSGVTHTFVMPVCPLQCGHFLVFEFQTVMPLKCTVQLFHKCAPKYDFDVSSLSDSLFLETLRKWCYVLLQDVGCLFIPLSDVTFDHVHDVMYAGFWCHVVTAFLFEVNRSRAQRYIGTIWIACFLSYF